MSDDATFVHVLVECGDEDQAEEIARSINMDLDEFPDAWMVSRSVTTATAEEVGR